MSTDAVDGSQPGPDEVTGQSGRQASSEQQNFLEQSKQMARGVWDMGDDEKRPFFMGQDPQVRLTILRGMQAEDPQKLQDFLGLFTQEEQTQIMQEAAKKDVDDAGADDDKTVGKRQNILDPDMPEEKRTAGSELNKLITDGRIPDGSGRLTNEDAIKPKLAGMTKEDAINYLRAEDIEEETIKRLTTDLTDVGEPEDIVTDLKKDELKAKGVAVRDRLTKEWTKVNERLDEPDLNQDEREDLEEKRSRMERLSDKIRDYFADGQPGRKYARRGGKILYYALLTAVILLLLEMNIINKAARRGGSRGGGG